MMRTLLPAVAAILGLVSAPLRAQTAVIDDLGRTVSLPALPSRIVSLAPSITETLFALGAEERIAGVTDYCTEPAGAAAKPRVGGMINPSIETIISLRPDLIILSMEGNVRDDFDRLTALAVPVFVTNPRDLRGIAKSIADLGALTGRSAAAGRIIAAMQSRERRITASARALPERSVLLVVSLQPLIVAGGGTFLAELLALAGGRNPAASSPSTYPQFSREEVLREDPDVLVILADAGPAARTPEDVYPEWSRLTAVRTGRVYVVDPDLLSRPGPRAVEALELLARLLHSTP